MGVAVMARNGPGFKPGAWDIPKGDGPGVRPDLRGADLAERLVVLLVHRLTDVVGGKGGEDQSLDGACEQA